MSTLLLNLCNNRHRHGTLLTPDFSYPYQHVGLDGWEHETIVFLDPIFYGYDPTQEMVDFNFDQNQVNANLANFPQAFAPARH